MRDDCGERFLIDLGIVADSDILSGFRVSRQTGRLSGLTGRSGLFVPGFVWPEWSGGNVTVVLYHGRFFDNCIQKKEKRGRQGPAELREKFNRYFGGHVSREDVTCV